MNIQNHKKMNKKRSISVVVTAVLVVAVLIIAYFLFLRKSTPSSSSQIDYNPPTSEEIAAGEAIKRDSEKTATDTAPTTPTTPSNTKTNTPMSIVSVNQDVSTLHIGTSIQSVTSSGNCTLAMTSQSGKTYTASVGVQAMPSYTTCKGFNVPVTSLSTEKWTIKVTYESNSSMGSATSSVEVK